MARWHMIFTAFAAVWGACLGSFLNVCIYRIPRDLSVVRPRSHCPNCGQPIPWYRNVPVLSYVLLRGRCAACKQGIAPRYVLVEALVGFLFALVWQQGNYLGATPPWGLVPMGSLWLIPIYWLIVFGLVLGTFVDFEHMIIPDRVTLGGMVAGLCLSALVPAMHGQTTAVGGLVQSGIGLVLGWGILYVVSVVGRMIFKQDAMGFGDVKLIGAIGAFLGWQAVLFTIVVSSFLGSVAGVGLVLARRREMQSRIPYGPYLALAALLWMFWGPHWWDAYLNLMSPLRVR